MDSFQKLQLQLFCKHGSLLGLETPPCPNSTFTTLHPLEEILQCFLPLGVTFCGIESPSKPMLTCLKMKSEGMIFRRRKLSFVIPENLSHCYPLPVTTLGAQSGNCVPVGRGSGKYLGIVQEEKFSTNTSCCSSSGRERSVCCPGLWERRGEEVLERLERLEVLSSAWMKVALLPMPLIPDPMQNCAIPAPS